MRLTSLLYISLYASLTLALPQPSTKLDPRTALEGGDARPGPILPREPAPEPAPEPDPRCLAEVPGIPGC